MACDIECYIVCHELLGDSCRNLWLALTFGTVCPWLPGHILQAKGVRQYYEPADPPCLYVGPAQNCVCRASLMECYMEGNNRPTIPYSMRAQHQAQFPFGKADGSNARENGSRLYELNHWMMLYGRGMKRDNTAEEGEAARVTRRS